MKFPIPAFKLNFCFLKWVRPTSAYYNEYKFCQNQYCWLTWLQSFTGSKIYFGKICVAVENSTYMFW